MLRQNETQYTDRYIADQDSLSLVEYNRPNGFLITTKQLDSNITLTKIRFITAGVADDDVHVYGKTIGNNITIVFSSDNPQMLCDDEDPGYGYSGVGFTLTQYVQRGNALNVRERFVKHWFNEGVYGHINYTIPHNCSTTVEADVKNGVLTVYIVTTENEQSDSEQWIDLVNSRRARQAQNKVNRVSEKIAPEKKNNIKVVIDDQLLDRYRKQHEQRKNARSFAKKEKLIT